MKYLHFFRISFYVLGALSMLMRFIETVYVFFFNKPIFIHAYLYKRKLPKAYKTVLVSKVLFYSKLNNKYQKYFEHRVATFLKEYNFVGRENFKITIESQVLIASTYVMMTFGMRKYITDVFKTIVIYPDSFYSKITKRKHKGEFNPMFKIIVFSWLDFLKGIAIDNDNIHLGIHEFAHVLSFHGKKSKDFSANVFFNLHEEITSLFNNKKDIEKLKKINYFRNYGFTNKLEFIAVILESFFETPNDFKLKLPDLYKKVIKMLNFKKYTN